MSDLKPYPYQTLVAERLLAGNSIVLQAPTGSGKTKAALLPFIQSWRTHGHTTFPTKCIYVVPMRVLANQFHEEISNHADAFERMYGRKLKVTLQTGEHQDDPRFEGDLIFSTIDQFLSSYLTMPYSQPYRLANINAGAIVGAYIVLDEFHLLDPQSTLPTTMYALKRLQKVAPVLLMTATFSADMLAALAKEIDAEPMLLSASQADAIKTRGNQHANTRKWHIHDTALTVDSVLNSHKHRSIAICNTVKRARSLFQALKHSGQLPVGTQLRLLHSQFLREDRTKSENALRTAFGKDADRTAGSWIVVATQTIEVGLDVSADTLHSELAPASSLIQRAGRCARYPGDAGNVHVYAVESYLPYSTDKVGEQLLANQMRAAQVWLEQHTGEVFDFAQEQALVNAVATDRDMRAMHNLTWGAAARAAEVVKAFGGERKGMSNLLVRDADSRTVLIHADPDALLLAPYAATGFSLQPSTLFGLAKEWLARAGVDADWRIKILIEDTEPSPDDDQSARYGWKEIHDHKLINTAQVIVVHPELAGYLADEGFVPEQGKTPFLSTLADRDGGQRDWDTTRYKLESYEDHIKLVVEAFKELALPELAFAAPALERAAGWQAGSLTRAAWLTVLLHDVGKLATGWQSWARAYHAAIGTPLKSGYAAAHTTFDRKNPAHLAAQKRAHGRWPKPPHAGEGSLACAAIIAEALDGNAELIKASRTAILRHHTAFADTCKPFNLRADAVAHIDATLQFIPASIQTSVNTKNLWSKDQGLANFGNHLIGPDASVGWMAYLLLVRALRRSDQLGTQKGAQ